MVADLRPASFPEGTREIRIVNNLKVYWDAISNRIRHRRRRDVRVAQVPLARRRWILLAIPQRNRLKPASDTIYLIRNEA